MTRVYYKEAVGAFIVFDITRADSFRAVEKWKTDLDTKVFHQNMITVVLNLDYDIVFLFCQRISFY